MWITKYEDKKAMLATFLEERGSDLGTVERDFAHLDQFVASGTDFKSNRWDVPGGSTPIYILCQLYQAEMKKTSQRYTHWWVRRQRHRTQTASRP